MREEKLFVLKVWRDGRGDEAWRASLKDLRNQDMELFDSLERLSEFIAEFKARQKKDGTLETED